MTVRAEGACSAQRMHSECGFTLIEILIVIFIISIVSGAALLSVSYNNNKQLESFANELTQQLTLAEQQAMLQPAVLGVYFNEESIHFFEYLLHDNHSKKKTNWQVLNDTILKKQSIPYGIQVEIKVANHQEESSKEAEPQIIFSTNGDVSPFEIYIGKKEEKPRYVILGKADGTIENKSLS